MGQPGACSLNERGDGHKAANVRTSQITLSPGCSRYWFGLHDAVVVVVFVAAPLAPPSDPSTSRAPAPALLLPLLTAVCSYNPPCSSALGPNELSMN